MSQQIVADNIRRIINEKGLKHCYVAEKAGIPPKKFSSMLNGHTPIKAEARYERLLLLLAW